MLSLTGDEYITAIVSSESITTEDRYLLLLTKTGIIKKIELKQIQNAKKGGIMAMQFRSVEEDYLVSVSIVNNSNDVFLASADGSGLRTSNTKMNAQGRGASGIIGMTLDEGDLYDWH